jgi:hypothetical protein
VSVTPTPNNPFTPTPTPGDDDLTDRDRDRNAVRTFSGLSGAERQQLIKRCRGIDSGGYDPALVKLCRLLETASR